MKFDPAGLDKWTAPVSFEVTRERLVEYAAATNDPIPAHASGDVASPVFAIVPVFQSLLEPALEVVPPSLFGRVLHGEQDFRFHRPIRPGDVLESRAKMTGWEGLPKGTRATVYLECRTSGGELVNEQYVTFFVRGFDAGSKVGELGPAHRFDEALRSSPPVAKVASTSTTTRRSATARPPATRCRSTSTRRSPGRRACRGSSRTGCARWRSRRGRC